MQNEGKQTWSKLEVRKSKLETNSKFEWRIQERGDSESKETVKTVEGVLFGCDTPR
jgi:hypothetical protein